MLIDQSSKSGCNFEENGPLDKELHLNHRNTASEYAAAILFYFLIKVDLLFILKLTVCEMYQSWISLKYHNICIAF